ncbi:MAG: EamA family transporter RarD [Candidatus Thermoplasmatota archaeon]|nr:EamA family transporter RarD [Candidatus Thermoplasmatota archaeon]
MDRGRLSGFLFALSAFTMWGVLPIYWKLLRAASPFEILSHRILWSLILVMMILNFRGNARIRKGLGVKDLLLLMVTSLLIGGNWLIYVLAVNSDRIIEASMGYYINPLLSVFLGMAVLREKLGKLKAIALILAICGVLYITIDYGRLPYIALSLASLFAMYGLLKKMSHVDPMQALGVEVMFLSPLAMGFILFKGSTGEGSFLDGGLVMTLLFIFAGVVTTLPLYWFAEATRRIDLSSVGFMQYIAPSIMLLIGVLIYGEDFTTAHIISFGLIWTALGLYTFSTVKELRKTPATTWR